MSETNCHVVDTPCYPARWKVESVKWPGRDNSTCNYFRLRGDAVAEAAKRNTRISNRDETPTPLAAVKAVKGGE